MSAPNEVYRKDLVSAMLITELPPDSSVHFQLQDNWKTEWERGVQVPAKLRQRKPQVKIYTGVEVMLHQFSDDISAPGTDSNGIYSRV